MMAKKQIQTTELVEVNGEIVKVTRLYDSVNGHLQERLDNQQGETLSVTNSRPNGFGIFGSVKAWMDYREATKEQRKKNAYENLRIAETQQEIREAQNAVDAIEWSENLKPDGWDGDCPIYGGIGWC
jgi:hypothetical protein